MLSLDIFTDVSVFPVYIQSICSVYLGPNYINCEHMSVKLNSQLTEETEHKHQIKSSLIKPVEVRVLDWWTVPYVVTSCPPMDTFLYYRYVNH